MTEETAQRYELADGWGRPPGYRAHLDVADVAIDARQRVLLVTRTVPSRPPGARAFSATGRTRSPPGRAGSSTWWTSSITRSRCSGTAASWTGSSGPAGSRRPPGWTGRGPASEKSSSRSGWARRPSTPRPPWPSARPESCTYGMVTGTPGSTSSARPESWSAPGESLAPGRASSGSRTRSSPPRTAGSSSPTGRVTAFRSSAPKAST
jgi:hypothetical protein